MSLAVRSRCAESWWLRSQKSHLNCWRWRLDRRRRGVDINNQQSLFLRLLKINFSVTGRGMSPMAVFFLILHPSSPVCICMVGAD